jgi:hypothetical protein
MTGSLHVRAQTPRRLRLSALVCMLLLLVASTAQVAHHHADRLPLARSGQQKSPPAPQQKDTENLCPLCIAMHSAMPAALHVSVVPVGMQHEIRPVPAVSRYASLWRFELFGRPPPLPVGA